MSRILLALLIDAVILAYPAYLGLQYRKLPPIHDITTDVIDPPRFEALARLRSGEGANSAVYATYSAEQQRLAFPPSRPWSWRFRRNAPMRSRWRWSPSANGL